MHDVPLMHQSQFLGNACHMLLARADDAPEKPAIVDGPTTVSYAELTARSLAIASKLADVGVGPDDRVAMLLKRDTDAAAAFFGTLAAGAVAVIVNEQLRPRQVEHILRHSGASVLLTSSELTDRLGRPLSTTATLVDITHTREGSAQASFAPTARIASDVAQIIYTSGSTGLPKGVTLSHSNLWAGMQAVTSYVGISETDRIASLLPFSFDYGLNQLLCAAGTGAALLIERSPIAARIVRTLREQAVTVLPAVPPLWLQLLNVHDFQRTPLPLLRAMTNTGGRLPQTAVQALRSSQGHARLFLMYGLTEAFRSTYLSPELVDRKPTSVGRAIPGAEVLVVDDHLKPCQPGEVGELVHRGPTVALGYWDDPAATNRVYRPNPLRSPHTPDAERVVFSGDLVYRDEDGDLFFVGRRDTMIKTLGYRVSPDEVTEALHASGEVVEAVVATEPDDLRGERIVAYVVLKDEGRLDRLERFVGEELPRYMQPSHIEVRNELMRTPSGKHDAAATARGDP